jgi:predicted nucleic acid-binding Zn ribbon protein
MNDRNRHSAGIPRNVYQQLRLRNERRMKLARQSEASRLNEIQRVVELSRELRFRAPGK